MSQIPQDTCLLINPQDGSVASDSCSSPLLLANPKQNRCLRLCLAHFNFILLIFLFLLIPFKNNGQQINTETQRISLKDDSGSTVFSITSKYQSVSTHLEKGYYWYKSRAIHFSKGGFSGKLLHGDYTAYFEDMSLAEKGIFKKGLKHGEWLKWHQTGELAARKYWRKGQPIKRAYHYSEQGILERIVRYRKSLARKIWYYSNDTLIKKEKYRNGKLKKEVDYLEKLYQKELENADNDEGGGEESSILKRIKKDEAQKEKRKLEKLRKRQEKHTAKEKESNENPKPKKRKFLFFGAGEKENQ